MIAWEQIHYKHIITRKTGASRSHVFIVRIQMNNRKSSTINSFRATTMSDFTYWHYRGWNHGIPANWVCLGLDVKPKSSWASHFEQAIPDCRSVLGFSVIFPVSFSVLFSIEPQGFIKNVQRGVHALSCGFPRFPHGQFAAHIPLRSLVISAYESNQITSIVSAVFKMEAPSSLVACIHHVVVFMMSVPYMNAVHCTSRSQPYWSR